MASTDFRHRKEPKRTGDLALVFAALVMYCGDQRSDLPTGVDLVDDETLHVDEDTSGWTAESADRGLLPPKGEFPVTYRDIRGFWEYEPQGSAFVVSITDRIGRIPVAVEELPTLAEAVRRFAVIALPVQDGWQAVVIDSYLTVVVGYAPGGDSTGQQRFPDGIWGGCRRGFDELERTGLTSPVDVAVWGAIAQRKLNS